MPYWSHNNTLSWLYVYTKILQLIDHITQTTILDVHELQVPIWRDVNQYRYNKIPATPDHERNSASDQSTISNI